MSQAKWRITKDHIGIGEADGVSGPWGCPDDSKDAGFTWTKFRMFDDDGELYYEGVMNEHCEGFEPLDHFGAPNAGCTFMKILTSENLWEVL